MLTGIRVREIMRNKVASTADSMSIMECAQKMAKEEVGSLVIEQNGKVLGIITEQDLARKALAKGLDPKTTKVSQLMTKKVHTIGPDQDIYEAVVKMGKEKIKHLPVVEQETLKGIISYKDIIKMQPGLIELLSFKSSLPKRMMKKVFFNR
ncbi:CBS domain-containing protein [Candidatus Woesearchaeota archaeon]|nr:CBS domain-containing protein [Candidatus Woesearchaeota archaeon]